MTKSQAQNKPSTESQLALAKAAASGEKAARQQVNELAQPMIEYNTSRFCKRFCNENQFLYRCTLKPPMGSMRKGDALCEWGNASYGWMLNDLSHEKRLLKYQGINGASLFDYFYQIANSLPFYERWKDWRFGRKVHVPTYINSLSPLASKIFLGLRSGDNLEMLAQKLATSVEDIEPLVHKIISLLTEKKRLHLLNPPSTVSLTETDEDHTDQQAGQQLAVASFDESIEELEDKKRLQLAWAKLEAVEQFVLEALLIENQDAEDVIFALKKMQLSIKSGISPDQTNRQQLYYFRRKSLDRLSAFMNE